MTEFSVIIPSYNHSRFVLEAVTSVLSQENIDLELIIVDDGSTDDSVSLLKLIDDKRVTVYCQANKGAHGAINKGLELSSGAYLAILNSDDIYCPERLKKAKEIFMTKPEVGMVCSYIEVIDEEGNTCGIKEGFKTLEPWILESPSLSFRASNNIYLPLLAENYLSTTSNFIFTRRALREVGLFNNLKYTHDWDFALRMIRKFDLYLIPYPLVKYRTHSSNTIRQNIAEMYFEICWILARHLPILSRCDKINLSGDLKLLQLLHSLHAGGAEKVIVGLMSLEIHEDDFLAEQLLEKDNQLRIRLVEYIAETLRKHQENPLSLENVSLKSLLNEIYLRIRKKLLKIMI